MCCVCYASKQTFEYENENEKKIQRKQKQTCIITDQTGEWRVSKSRDANKETKKKQQPVHFCYTAVWH